MRFYWIDYIKACALYVANAPNYDSALQFVQSGVEDADINALKMWLRRLDNEHIAFILTDSTTDGKDCNKEIIRNGKVGRPKKRVEGKKVKRHIHGLIISTDSSNDINEIKQSLSKYCNKRRKKRPNLKQQKIGIIKSEYVNKGLYIAKYIDRQADHEYRGGDFNFNYFKDERYYTLYDDNFDNILNFDKVDKSQ